MLRTMICLLLASLSLVAQPHLTNAQLQTRSAAAGLDREFRALVDGATAPAWIGYAVPAVAGDHHSCCCNRDHGCTCCLEGNKAAAQTVSSAPIKLEGPQHLMVLFRVEQRQVGKIRVFSEDCALDAGGLPVHWLVDVQPPQSVELLAGFAAGAEDRARDGAVVAIALHAGSEADQALERFTAASQPEKLREKAVFWLGAARGRRGYETLRRLVREDPSERVRDKVVFALSVSKEPEAVDAMIDTARRDASARVRGQALFWLAQKAGKKAVAAIGEALANDPETDVKKRAVFALSQLKEDGVPMLIQVARTNRNPEVRKQAIFWLGQSRDPRALGFFEEVLTGRRP